MSEDKKLNAQNEETPETALELDDSIFQDDLNLDFGTEVSTADLEQKLADFQEPVLEVVEIEVEAVEAAPVAKEVKAEVPAARVLTKEDIKAQAKRAKEEAAEEAAEAKRLEKEEKRIEQEKAAAEKQKADAKNKKAKDKKKGDKKSLWSKIRDIFGELKKVTWPDGKTVLKQTLVVLGVTIFFLVCLMVIDFGFSKLFGWFGNSL